MNNTACLNGLRMTAAEKKHRLILKNGKHVSKYYSCIGSTLEKIITKPPMNQNYFLDISIAA